MALSHAKSSKNWCCKFYMQAIETLIPHRPPFLFVDKILHVDEQGAVAERTLRVDEAYFAGHYPQNPIMPGVLLCEAIFQTAAAYMAVKLGQNAHQGTPVLARIEGAKFKKIAKPGDTLTIKVEFKETLQNFYFMKGNIKRGDELMMTVEFALTIAP